MIKALLRFVKDKLSFKRPSAQDQAQTFKQNKATPTRNKLQTNDDSPRLDKRSRQERVPRRDDWHVSQYVVEPAEGKTRFHDLNLNYRLMHAIADLEFQYCSPIQAEVLPHTLAGKDAIGQAQTGTGKTAAFLITIFTHILRKRLPAAPPPGTPRALILAPTRELVIQIGKDAEALSRYTRISCITLFGGMDYRKQQKQLERRVDVVIATPGRLLDFQQRQDLQLGKVEVLVLDEADRMLDMGFIPDVRRIIYSTPQKHLRQTLFFSATFTEDVNRLASSWTRDAVKVQIEPENVAAETVEQRVYIVTAEQKFQVLVNLISSKALERVMVFVNRRDETRRLTDNLRRYGIQCAMLSGDVPQAKRSRTLENFRSGTLQVLVATDVAGRGIHVDGVSYVVNYNLPTDPEDYVHRIGRTGRAGNLGVSISFACEEEAFQLPEIEAYLGQKMHCVQPEEDLLQVLPVPQAKEQLPHENGADNKQNENQPRRSRHHRGKRQHPRRPPSN